MDGNILAEPFPFDHESHSWRPTLSARGAYYLSWLAHACGRAGRRQQAESLIEELAGRSREAYVSPTFFAWAFAGLGDTAAALTWVERACEERNPPLMMHQETLLRDLQAEPRFRAVRARMGLGVDSRTRTGDHR
jgi:hypothetical protein